MSNIKKLLEDDVTFIKERTDIPEDIIYAYFDEVGGYYEDIEDFISEISDATYGYWETSEDFARDALDSFVDFNNEWWAHYIDFKRMGEDLLNIDYFGIDYCGGVWVFRNI